MRAAVSIGLVCAGLALSSALPPIGGSVRNNDYDVSWSSTATQAGGWTLAYLLHNSRNTHVRVVWKDAAGNDIYNGWLPETRVPQRVCTLDIGTVAPQAPWESWIDVGKLSPRNTNVYEPQTAVARRVTSKSMIGVLLKGEVRLLSLTANSVYTSKSIRYSLSLGGSEFSGMVRFSWTAADSTDFRTALSKREGSPFIRLGSEPLNIEIPAAAAPRIRNGSLIVWNESGLRLASVLAPALTQ